MRSMLTGRNRINSTVLAFTTVLAIAANAAWAAPVVYVDNPADFTPANPSNGDPVTWNGPGGPIAAVYGTDAFGTIQDGLDNVDPNGLVLVAEGTYEENPVITTNGVTLRGPQHLVLGRNRVTNALSNTLDPVLPDDTTEAILVPAINDILDGTLLTVEADDVTIEGMMFVGRNPNLGPETWHTARGISNGKETNGQFLDNLTDFEDDVDSLVIQNNITAWFYRMGILLARNDAAASDVLPALIQGNFVTYQTGAAIAIPPPYSPFLNSQFERTGIWTGNNFYADIIDNTVTRTALGILINTHQLPAENAAQTLVTNNRIKSEVLGMWVDRVSNTGGGIRIAGNVVESPYRAGQPLINPFGLNANGFRNDGYRMSFVSTVGAIELEGNNTTFARYGILTYGVEDTANIIWKGGLVNNCETSIYALNWLDALPAPLTPGPSNLTIEDVNIGGSRLDSIAVEDIYHIDGVPGVPQPTRVTLTGNTSMTNFQLSAVFIYGPMSQFATTGPGVNIETGVGVFDPVIGIQPVINVFDGGPEAFDIEGAKVTTDRAIAGIWATALDGTGFVTLRDSIISSIAGGPTGEIIRVDGPGTFFFEGLNEVTGHIVNDGSLIDEIGAPASVVRFLGPPVEQRIDTIPPGVTTFPTMQIANNVRVLEFGQGLTTRTGPLLFNIGGNSVLERVIFGLTPADEGSLLDFGLTEAQIIFEAAGGSSVGLNGITTLRVQRRPVNAITPEIPSNEKFNILGNNFDSAVTINQLRLPVATPTLAAFQAAYPGPVIHKTSDPARFFFLDNGDFSQNIPGGTGYVTYNGFTPEPSLVPWIEQRSDNINTPFFVSNNLTVLKVELVGFNATRNGNTVTVNWSTASEIDHSGFNVHRVAPASTSAMPNTLSLVNEALVTAKGGASTGAEYALVDSEPMVPGESRNYMLEEVDVNGLRTFHGPVTVTYGTSGDSSVTDWSQY
jgi:hypothetical protein